MALIDTCGEEGIALMSFSEDGCAKCQKPNALQQQRGLNPSGNDGRQAAMCSRW